MWQYLSLQAVGVREPGKPFQSIEAHHLLITTANLSLNGNLIATSGNDSHSCCKIVHGLYGDYKDDFITKSSTRIWDAHTLELKAELPTLFYQVVLSPDGQTVVGHTPTGIEAWDWKTQQRLWFADGNVGDLCGRSDYGRSPQWCRSKGGNLAMDPQGRYVASYAPGVNNAVRLYRLTTGELVTTFTGHTAGITDLAFSPDGSKLAASSLDGTILIWNVP